MSALTTTNNQVTTYTTGILGDGTYQWCVRNYDQKIYSDWVSMGSFTIQTLPTILTITQGNHQSGDMLQSVTTPLQVRVTTDSGDPVEGVEVRFAFSVVPTAPLAQGQSITVSTALTNADGYAQTGVTLGDRAGVYRVEADFDGVETPVANRTFMITQKELFVLTVSQTHAQHTINPTLSPSQTMTTTVTVRTNARSFAVTATPQSLPTRHSGTQTIPSWTTWGFGWSNQITQVAPTAFAGGGTGDTIVWSCSGDACQSSTGIIQDITLHHSIDWSIPAGVYSNTTLLTGSSLQF